MTSVGFCNVASPLLSTTISPKCSMYRYSLTVKCEINVSCYKAYISLSLFSITQYNLYFNISTFNLYSIRECKESESVWDFPILAPSPDLFNSGWIILHQGRSAGVGMDVVLDGICQHRDSSVPTRFSYFSPCRLLLKYPSFTCT